MIIETEETDFEEMQIPLKRHPRPQMQEGMIGVLIPSRGQSGMEDQNNLVPENLSVPTLDGTLPRSRSLNLELGHQIRHIQKEGHRNHKLQE